MVFMCSPFVNSIHSSLRSREVGAISSFPPRGRLIASPVTSVAQNILGNGPEVPDERVHPRCKSPLFSAIESDNLAVMELEIMLGADIDIAEFGGWTPLHAATKVGSLAAMELMIIVGAKINAPLVDGTTPLHVAAKIGHVAKMKLLIEAKANINASTDIGVTPLYRAAKKGHVDAMKLLIDYGADVNAFRCDGVTPLYRASREGHVEAIKLLLHAGAEINAAKADGKTPLYIAVIRDHMDAAYVLIQAGADLLVGEGAYPQNTLELALLKSCEINVDALLLPFLDQQEQAIAMTLKWLQEPLLEVDLEIIVEVLCRQLTIHQTLQHSSYESKYFNKASRLHELLSSQELILNLTNLQRNILATLDHNVSREELEKSLKKSNQYAEDLGQIRVLVHVLLKKFGKKKDNQSVALILSALTGASEKLLALIKHYEELALRCSSKMDQFIPPDQAFDEAEVFGLLASYGLGVAIDNKKTGVQVTPEDSYFNLVGAGPESIMEAGLETGRDLRWIGITLETSRSEALDILRRFLEKANVQRIKAMLKAEGQTCVSCLGDFSTRLIAN